MKNCLIQVLELSKTESHLAMTNLYENFPEHFISYVHVILLD